MFTLLGENVQSEVHSSLGRADCIVKTEAYIYVFEFKLDQSADVALKQIEGKGYTIPNTSDKRKVFKIGINYSSEARNIDGFLVKIMKL